MKEAGAQTLPPHLIGLLALLTLAWGFNWPMIKLALSGMAPMHFRTLCVAAGAASLFAMAAFARVRIVPPRDEWGRLALIAFFNVMLWNVFTVYGIAQMASGRAAILGYTMPLWGVLLSAWLLAEPFTRRRAAGVALGMSGMLLLLWSELHAVERAPTGALAMVAAAISWAIGLVLVRKWPSRLPHTSYTGWQLVVGGLPIVAWALFFEAGSFDPFALAPAAMAGVLYNMFVAFGFCYWAFTKISRSAPVGVSSLASLLIPVVGVFSGALVLGERPRWADYAALLLVVGALATVLIPSRAPPDAASSPDAAPRSG